MSANPRDSVLTFDEPTHTYTVGGRVVPSVTTVIGAVWPELWAHCSEFARDRGGLVHKALSYWLEGDLDESAIGEGLAGYIEAAKRFFSETGFELEAHEQRVFSGTHWFAGTLDLRGSLNGKRTLADWKTGFPGWACGLQTAAYCAAYHEMSGELIPNRLGIHLHQNGTYTLTEYKDRGDWADFQAALRVYRRKVAA